MAPRILLADTAEGALQHLARALRDAGYTVCEAIEPQQLMDVFEQLPADAIVLHVGRADALANSQALRAHALGATVPLIFVAGAWAPIDSPAQALAAGADALWRLPVDLTAALKRLGCWLGPAKSHLSVVTAAQSLAGPPPPPAGHMPRLRRLFGRAPTPVAALRPAPQALGMAPPPAWRRAPSPSWPPRGLGGGQAVAVQEPEVWAPWADPDAAAREHIRRTCAQMQVMDYYTLAQLPLDAPYLIVERTLKALEAQFMPE